MEFYIMDGDIIHILLADKEGKCFKQLINRTVLYNPFKRLLYKVLLKYLQGILKSNLLTETNFEDGLHKVNH